jgi:hypothetical protein
MDKSYIYTRRDLWTVEQTLEAAIDERAFALARAETAEAECERLREVLADIAAADADASFAMSSLALAALDNSGQDAAGG